MVWPTSKLDLINECLALAGDEQCNNAEDGSDEWKCGSAGYEMGIEYLSADHNWNFATIAGVLITSDIAPTDDYFTNAYDKPPDLIHLVWVRLDDQPVVWQILKNQIVLNAFGTLPGQVPPSNATQGVVTAKWVSSTKLPEQAGRHFMTALKMYTMAGIYRGLHEDLAESALMEKRGEAMLAKAKTRSDQEQPKRSLFNSRLYAARRVRRPWPAIPTGWGGTGSPG
jgi:hypothetical protein